jgi:hypothetical protein
MRTLLPNSNSASQWLAEGQANFFHLLTAFSYGAEEPRPHKKGLRDGLMARVSGGFYNPRPERGNIHNLYHGIV